MTELISVIDEGHLSQKIHKYSVGIHNMKLKEKYSDEEIEEICEEIKNRFIRLLKKK
jgi:hypothetical protein